MKLLLSLSALLCCIVPIQAEKINLWPEGHATLRDTDPKDNPTLDLFHVKSGKPVAAILIIPGGGYKAHSSGAWSTAKECQEKGIAAYVLRYRLPSKGYRHPLPLEDAQRAMRLIRHQAKKWNIDPKRIGVFGSSSGGHLSTLLSNSYDAGDPKAEDPIDQVGCRPDFTILMAPVVTFLKPHAHLPSRIRMLGRDATDDEAAKISPEKLVTPDTPPAIIFANKGDGLVPAANSELYAAALKKHEVPVELTVVDAEGHGYSPEMKAGFTKALEGLAKK